MPKVYGRVLALARESLGVSQTALGRELEVQPSTISRIEKGVTTLPVYFLDHVAIALTRFAEAQWGPDAQGWEGHKLHELATRVGHTIANMGFTVMWGSPKKHDTQEDLFVDDITLAGLVKRAWPDDERHRLGW
jgi:transcriptional regulator with XRE-family HTH domain